MSSYLMSFIVCPEQLSWTVFALALLHFVSIIRNQKYLVQMNKTLEDRAEFERLKTP